MLKIAFSVDSFKVMNAQFALKAMVCVCVCVLTRKQF